MASHLEAQDVDIDADQIYLVHTHPFTDPDAATTLQASIGANWTNVNAGAFEDDAIRWFASAEVGLTDRISLSAEWQSEETDLGDTDPLSSIALRAQLSGGIGVQVGYTNAGFALPGQTLIGLNGTGEHNLFAGITFGGGVDTEAAGED